MEKQIESSIVSKDKHQNISSPTNNHSTNLSYFSTPKGNRSFDNSKSPFGKIKLKKSRRRECTPAYSPKNQNLNKAAIYHTEKKCSLYSKLDFEISEMDKLSFLNNAQIGAVDNLIKNENLFTEQNKSNSLLQPKKKFLSLIEESLNEVSDVYLGVLGSQTTPDTIFNNIFWEEKSKRNSNDFKKTDSFNNMSSLDHEDLLNLVIGILDQIKNKNFEILSLMVNNFY
jgi:hypothetical protein